ncbi:uncharacterized protein LOC123557081 [Mercenaria mercenaria]|uniref:uncharacterized protein LOC123557081 n=1 Tax=Mercenaria mercenaria TaxID=6596 RepID=UPI00234F8C84|nr:uncharacterized protein LOC123557081 [Mercenaria mercenaria]
MFQQPGYIENVSLRLSEVLADIGVNERITLKRRRAMLLVESMYACSYQIIDANNFSYVFGSQSEGTTTPGLKSDTDQLMCINNCNVIQDWADWEPGVLNLLMIQDETVSPGYCLLQRLRDDAPLPCNHVPDKYHCRDRTGRVLKKNIIMTDSLAVVFGGGERHGPAYAEQGRPGTADSDTVLALTCKSWPLQARQRLDWQGVGEWPSNVMKRYCSNTGCFVVGVGSKGSQNEEFEWRISTSLAERCLMFNLNITQIRCYVLMKMILKTFIKPHFEDNISSFMCKTVLFHCIANTSDIWRENNLLVCLSICLFVLYNSILNENCSHFLIPRNNLMRGHISLEYKPYILEILLYIINSEGRVLLEIECDGLCARLWLKLSYLLSFKTNDIVSGQLLHLTARCVDQFLLEYTIIFIRNSGYAEAIQQLLKAIFKLVITSTQCQGLDKTASSLMARWYCTTLGSVLASLNIQQHNAISAEALTWVSLGLNTDVASGKLKLASMFYCIGDTQRAEIVLRDIERSYDLNIVEPICLCNCVINDQAFRREFNAICDNHNEEVIKYTTANCVKFLPCEINCVPHELRHEMFRSTQEDLAFRGLIFVDGWMDLAVVDSLPYLYFLQYKTYSSLGRQEDKQRALSNVVRTINQEPNLGHRETAMNLLGQCMEKED